MPIAQDISTGKDAIPALYDVLLNRWIFTVDGEEYIFDAKRMPFTLVDLKGKHTGAGADRSLVLANAHKQVRKRYL